MHLGTSVFQSDVCHIIYVLTHPCHTTGYVSPDCANVLIDFLRILDKNIHKHCVIVSNVCVCLIICLIMINSHISFTLRHVLSLLLCDVSPYSLICTIQCLSCLKSRFPYCPTTPYPYALDWYEFLLRFWTITTPLNGPCESVSGHVVCFRSCKASTSPLSVVLCAFFRFSHHVLLTYLTGSGKSEKASKLLVLPKVSPRLTTKKEKTWLDQTMHPLTISASSSWDVVSVVLYSSASVIFSDQRTSSRALQTETLKTCTGHLQQEHLNAAPLFSASFDPDSWFCALQAAQTTKRNFHDIFTNPVQKLFLRKK